jgi:hypothetical protein
MPFIPNPETKAKNAENKVISSYLQRVDSLISKTLADDKFNPDTLNKLLKIRSQLKSFKS